MKKILFSLSIFTFLLIPHAKAEDSMMCLQVIQAAVDSNGTCKEFSTPCDVPDGWKTLPTSSCNDVESNKRGSRIDEVQNRRQRLFNRSLRRIAQEKAPEIQERKYRKRSDRPRYGASKYTRNFDSIDNQTNRERATLGTRERRTFSRRSYQSNFSHQRRLRQTNSESNTHQAKKRPRIISRTTGARTTGTFSNDPKLSDRQEQRFRSNGYGRHWRNRGRVTVEKKETADPRRKIGQRRTFRGNAESRRSANIGGSIE